MIPLLVLFTLAGGPVVVATPFDGEAVRGELAELTDDELALVSQPGEPPIRFSRSAILDLSFEQEPGAVPAAPVLVELVDGSRLGAGRFEAADEQASLDLEDGSPLSLSSASIASVRFLDSGGRWDGPWAEIRGRALSSDLLVLRRAEALDFMEGVVGNVTAADVQFRLDGDEIPVKRGRIEGLLYYHAPSEGQPEAVAAVHAWDKTAIQAASVRLDGEHLAVESPSGARFSLALSSVRRIDLSVGRVAPLGVPTLPPELAPRLSTPGAKETLALGLAPVFFETSQSAPSLGGRQPSRGIRLRSRTTLTWTLARAALRLDGWVGLEDGMQESAVALFKVTGDGRTLFECELRPDEEPRRLTVPLDGIKRLSVIVDYGPDNDDTGDRVVLAEPRIIQ